MTSAEHEDADPKGALPSAAQDNPQHGEAEHNEFDCSRARLQLFEYLDGEMGQDDCAKIREHLEHCGTCLHEYDLDQMLKSLVRRSCGCEAAPMELRMQIMTRITTFSLTVELTE